MLTEKIKNTFDKIAEEYEKNGKCPNRTYICNDSGWRSFMFVNPKNGIRKPLIYEEEFIDYPEIENPEYIMQYYKESRTIIKRFGFGSRCEICHDDENKCIVYWCIQPDGRYYADEGGFGAEDQLEIVLYAYIDENGNYEGKFRIKKIGSTVYFGTDLEDSKVAEFNKRKFMEYKEAATPEEACKALIRRGLDVLLAENRYKYYVDFDVPTLPYVARMIRYHSEADIDKPYDLRVSVFIPGESYQRMTYTCYCSSEEEFNEYISTDKVVDEVYKVVLNLLKKDRL